MLTAGPLDQLRALLPADRLLTDPLERYTIDGQQPGAALLPEAVAEIQAILRVATEQRLALIPWGAGRHMDLGNRPARYDLALDLSRLNAIVAYSPEDLVVTAQTGVTLGALGQHLREHGQFLALDTPLAGEATIGGALSANLPAPNRLRYGTARDLVIGLTCVLAGGELVHSGGRVVKNVAGYDLNKLYLGALGTLGVIVEASFKLHPRPPVRAALLAAFAASAPACAAALAIANSPLGAIAVELAGPPLAQALAARIASPNGWLLAVFLAGLPAAVERQRQEVMSLLREADATAEPDVEIGAQLYAALRDAGRTPERSAALLLRCSVLPSEVAGVIDRLAAEPGLRGAQISASPGSGTVRLLWPEPPVAAPAIVAAARGQIAALGGNVVVERCPAELRPEIDVWGLEGLDVALMRAMKAAYDPTGILSPGRLLPGD